ncbi:MAG: peptide chain release factor 3 [Pseudomonadota bacterium]
MPTLEEEVARRRTFAIISHPDAGKTTLTEKLLLFGGAIEMAGAVKARGDRRRARSDWMKVEQERGISVASSVMTFENDGKVFNLLDTPGHEDFSEDTYRTLSAVDAAIMVLDAAKGIETQTRKLFEVCRLRDVPIVTFINKLDREGQDPFTLLDEIEQGLALDVSPASWPIGMGRNFKGCYDLFNNRLVMFDRAAGDRVTQAVDMSGLDDPKLADFLEADEIERLRDEVDMAQGLCPEFDREAFLQGTMTPVYFGSAINNFGVRELLNGVGTYAPSPTQQSAQERSVDASEKPVTAFVFKIQANMDPKHRDRIAFVRLCSGHFKRGMKLTHVASSKQMTMHSPQLFLARDREVAEDAYAGDIVGLPNHGALRIGDTLTEGETLKFNGIPSFAPEFLQKVRPEDPMKAKHLGRALVQLAEEGAARSFKPLIGSDWIVGVVGPLQFDILADRVRSEYDIPIRFEATQLYTARWLEADQERDMKDFVDSNRTSVAQDHLEDWVFLARNAWHLDKAQEDYPALTFLARKTQV